MTCVIFPFFSFKDFFLMWKIFRFFIEFFRRPDAHLGRVDLFGMSRGQTLCSVMFLTGLIWLIVLIYRQKKANSLPRVR